MNKKIAAGAAAVVVAVGAGVGARVVTNDSAPCQKPLTILGTEQDASIKVLEAYISENIAPTYKSPQTLSWESDDFSPTVQPKIISARIVVYSTGSGENRAYHVTLTRDCQGGDWKVVEFKRLPK